jgi:hypothetical protein
MPTPALLSVREVARLLGVCPAGLRLVRRRSEPTLFRNRLVRDRADGLDSVPPRAGPS